MLENISAEKSKQNFRSLDTQQEQALLILAECVTTGKITLDTAIGNSISADLIFPSERTSELCGIFDKNLLTQSGMCALVTNQDFTAKLATRSFWALVLPTSKTPLLPLNLHLRFWTRFADNWIQSRINPRNQNSPPRRRAENFLCKRLIQSFSRFIIRFSHTIPSRKVAEPPLVQIFFNTCVFDCSTDFE